MSHNVFHAGLLNIESRGIALSAAILAVAAIASRLLGVWRDWLLAQYFGASADLDVYFAAFRIPDFIYNLLVFGGITVAFLPLFSDYYSKNKEEAWRFANNTMNVFSVFLVLVCGLLFIFTPQLVALIAPGFTAEQLVRTAFLSRLMFVSPIIFGIASVFSGILQYFRRFLAYSLAALLYNAGIIAGIIFLAPTMGITGVGIGVIFGASLYLLIQMAPAFRCGFCYKPVFSFRESSLAKVFGLMLPRTLGIAANQINLVAPTIIASALPAGSITVFNLSNNIYALPVGVIGVSYATAAFVSFSKLYAENKTAALAEKFSASYRQIGYLTVPAVILLFMLRRPVVDILYYHGQFSLEAARLTSASLGLFCLGIYFASMMPVIFRLFFSMRDTATPTLTTVVSVFANIVLNYWLVAALAAGPLARMIRSIFDLGGVADIGVLGLSLAYSLANALQFVMLLILLYRKDAAVMRASEIIGSLAKTVLAGIFMAVAVYFVSAAMPVAGTLPALAAIAAASTAGMAVYGTITLLTGSAEALAVKQAIANKWNRTNRKSGTL